MLRRGALLFPILVLFAGASLIREAHNGVLARVEEHWAGWLARRSTAPATAQVTLIEINDDTLVKHVWPWGAADFAVFLHAALPFGPSGIAIEPVLDADRGALAGAESDTMFEKTLHDGILRAPKLILGGQLGWAPEANAVADLQPMPVLRDIAGDVAALPEFTHIAAWAEERYRLSTRPGWTNLPDSTGPRGLCPLLFRYRGQPVPSITLQLAMDWARVTLDEVRVVLGSHIALGAHRIPIDARGRMAVNPGAAPARVAYDPLILAREQIEKGETPGISPGLVKDRVLILGRTDSVFRKVPMPGGAAVAPAELFATGLATIQTGAHVRRIGAWFGWVLLALAAAGSLWLPRARATRIALLILAVELLYFTAAWFIFRSAQLILPGVLAAGLAAWLLILRLLARSAHRVIAF